jgi:hypothetical protein
VTLAMVGHMTVEEEQILEMVGSPHYLGTPYGFIGHWQRPWYGGQALGSGRLSRSDGKSEVESVGAVARLYAAQ